MRGGRGSEPSSPSQRERPVPEPLQQVRHIRVGHQPPLPREQHLRRVEHPDVVVQTLDLLGPVIRSLGKIRPPHVPGPEAPYGREHAEGPESHHGLIGHDEPRVGRRDRLVRAVPYRHRRVRESFAQVFRHGGPHGPAFAHSRLFALGARAVVPGGVGGIGDDPHGPNLGRYVPGVIGELREAEPRVVDREHVAAAEVDRRVVELQAREQRYVVPTGRGKLIRLPPASFHPRFGPQVLLGPGCRGVIGTRDSGDGDGEATDLVAYVGCREAEAVVAEIAVGAGGAEGNVAEGGLESGPGVGAPLGRVSVRLSGAAAAAAS
mmetsp:Transcript_3566/g.7663  ORF Transcript_3566/g.7663 Transcript_3566/m.7663 type:complete len:320 (-) Transcript_3566:448-1407(-)